MFQSLDFVVLGCFLLTVETIPGQISPPQNLSLWWLDDFQPQLTWHPVSNCTYTVTSKTSEEYSLKEESHILPPWKGEMVIEGGFVNLSVKTVCGEQESLPEALSVDYSVVVKNLQCYLYTSKEANCTWEPDNSVSSFKFFYRLTIEDLSRSSRNSSFLPRLQECSNYLHTSSLDPDIITGCSLQANISNGIIILFNGTANSTFFRNAFKKYLKEDVRPPALNWTVIKTGGKFHISWTRPDIDLPWTYKLNYTECNKHLERDELNHASMQVGRDPSLYILHDYYSKI
uniref:Type I cytokine receptor cytokine-binding domain-containing protein n=1 Tax=Lates calcarifer TaxID=8187 RepID=A0A4W6D543_LATCA